MPATIAASTTTAPTRTEKLRITYVYDSGETEPSVVSPAVVGILGKVTVHSPVAQAGVRGYNLYAASPAAAGVEPTYIRQNEAPIPIGTDVVEPDAGWVANGPALPADQTSRSLARVLVDGSYATAPQRTDLAGATILFPTSRQGSDGIVAVRTLPTDPSTVRLPRGAVADAVTFTFDRPMTFTAYPSFYMTPSREAPMYGTDATELVLDDVTSGETLVTMIRWSGAAPADGVAFFATTSHVGVDRPFRALAGHVYRAKLIVRPLDTAGAAATLTGSAVHLVPAGNIDATLRLPPLASGGGTIQAASMTQVPFDTPNLPSSLGSPLAVYDITPIGNVVFSEPAELDFTIPRGFRLAEESIGVAVYDQRDWTRGWVPLKGLVKISPSGSGHVLLAGLTALPGRRYDIALYRTARNARSAAAAPKPVSAGRPIVAVLGDSAPALTVISPSIPRCSPITYQPPFFCAYGPDRFTDYPGIVGQLRNVEIENFAWPNMEAVNDNDYTESALKRDVPQIPTNAAFVIIGLGIGDVIHSAPQTLIGSRVDQLTAAVHAKAPKARIIYVGIRYFNDTIHDGNQKPMLEDWNAHARALAPRYGAFVDVDALMPRGPSEYSPDGAHYSLLATRLIAQAIVRAMDTLGLAAQPPKP